MNKMQAIDSRVTEWQQKVDRHQSYEKVNPFSGSCQASSSPSDDKSAEKTHSINSRLSQWQENADRHQNYQKKNSSTTFRGLHYQNLGTRQDDMNYGCPVEGSKTEFRGKAAGVHVSSEVIELCRVIGEMGTPQPDGSIAVRFGELFELYTRISNKVVGMLMRARRQGLVDFEGEMLYQRRDDNVIIRLIRTPDELMQETEKQKEELKHHPAARGLKQ